MLLAAADNALLTETVMGLRDKMRLYGINSRAGLDRQNESVAEHYEIVDLAMKGDANALTALLKRHIRAWEPIFVDALTRTARETLREPLVAVRARSE